MGCLLLRLYDWLLTAELGGRALHSSLQGSLVVGLCLVIALFGNPQGRLCREVGRVWQGTCCLGGSLVIDCWASLDVLLLPREKR